MPITNPSPLHGACDKRQLRQESKSHNQSLDAFAWYHRSSLSLLKVPQSWVYTSAPSPSPSGVFNIEATWELKPSDIFLAWFINHSFLYIIGDSDIIVSSPSGYNYRLLSVANHSLCVIMYELLPVNLHPSPNLLYIWDHLFHHTSNTNCGENIPLGFSPMLLVVFASSPSGTGHLKTLGSPKGKGWR